MRRPELWRTTTFRLALLYGAVFAAGVVALLGLIYVSAAIYLTHQMDEIVVGHLARWPESMRASAHRPDVRVAPLGHYPYKIFYRVRADTVEILHIHHAAREPWDEQE